MFEKRIYTDQQLAMLNQEIEEGYLVHKTFKDGTSGYVFQEDAYMIDKGAMTKDGRIGVPPQEIQGDRMVWPRCKYQEERNLLEQWINWLGRNEFGKQKRLEQLDEYKDLIDKF